MKKQIVKFVLLSLFPLWAGCAQVPTPIAITEEMVINETGSGEAMNWFDEQNLDAIPQTRFDTYGMTSFWPAGIVVDFGYKHRIESVWIFDGKESNRVAGGKLRLSMGRPFHWTDSVVVSLTNEGKWIKVNCPFDTRYIQVLKQATRTHHAEGYDDQNYDLAVNEILFMGYPTEEKPVAPKGKEFVSFNVPMHQFIGMNSYIYTPDKVHEAVGNVREYRGWFVNGVTDLNTPIDWSAKPTIGAYPCDGDGDKYYKKMVDMGIECMPCIHRHVDKAQEELIPNFGSDPNIPASYSIMADYCFQFVARYGHRVVEEKLLRTTEPRPKKSGLGYIRYFENWNEGDRWWGTPAGHFTPYQFAAYCSASYDGHQGTMGKGMGAKTADPGIKFSFGGLAELGVSCVQAMKLWADEYRNGSFPADVINLHHYCNTRGKQHAGGKAYGVSPEADKLKERLAKIVKWRNKNLPDVELWLTEFGWDTDESTYQSSAFGHALYPDKITMNELQGQWLVRAYLAGSAAGFERLQMFLANDLRNYKLGVYGSCVFVTVNDEFKPSWYYVKTLKCTLADMLFKEECTSGNDNVWIYRYHNPPSGKEAYVLWCPTSDGTVVEDFKLTLNRGVKAVTRVSLEDKMEFGRKEELAVTDNMVTVNVSERPVILVVDNTRR